MLTRHECCYVMLIALLYNLVVILLLLFLLFKVITTVLLQAVLILLFSILQNETSFLLRLSIVAVILFLNVLLALVFITGFWNDIIILGLISASLPSRFHFQAHLTSISQWTWLFLFFIHPQYKATFNNLAVLLIRSSLLNLLCWILSIKGAIQIWDLATWCDDCIRFEFFFTFIYYCRLILATLGLPDFLYTKDMKVISYSWFYEQCAALWCFSKTFILRPRE